MKSRRPFGKRETRDPLAGLTDDMRDALEAGARALLFFSECGDVRAATHFDEAVCKSAVMRVLIGLSLFEPVGDGEALQLTRRGKIAAQLSAARRASFAARRAREAANLAEGREFITKIYRRRESL